MAATALNIPYCLTVLLVFSIVSEKDLLSHSMVWSFIPSSDNLKHFLSHKQFVVFIKYKSLASQQNGHKDRERTK